MRIYLMLLAIVHLCVFTNEASAENIAQGVQVVVIDPGHGGKFVGAVRGGVHEKDIALGVSLKLGRLIEKNMPGVQVVYTRTKDMEHSKDLAVDLQARANIAHNANADLFISIHANASRNTLAYGTETLVMGETAGEQSRNENALFENNREDLIDMSDERQAAIVRAYIQNLQFTYGEYSMALARCIENNYTKAGRHSRGIKQQPLKVLYATDMPSVLTEIGFMSNLKEFVYMNSEAGQNELANALYHGVKDYSDYVLKTRKAGAAADTNDSAAVEQPSQPSHPAQSAAGALKSDKTDANGKTNGADKAKTDKSDDAKQPARSKPTDNAAAQSGQPKPADTSAAEPAQGNIVLRYTIQIMSSTKSVPVSSSEFKSYRNKVKEYAADGKYPFKYCIGEYSTREQAQVRLASVRKTFPDAFIVSCLGDRIVK